MLQHYDTWLNKIVNKIIFSKSHDIGVNYTTYFITLMSIFSELTLVSRSDMLVQSLKVQRRYLKKLKFKEVWSSLGRIGDEVKIRSSLFCWCRWFGLLSIQLFQDCLMWFGIFCDNAYDQRLAKNVGRWTILWTFTPQSKQWIIVNFLK